jgi:hypothetical protein
MPSHDVQEILVLQGGEDVKSAVPMLTDGLQQLPRADRADDAHFSYR